MRIRALPLAATVILATVGLASAASAQDDPPHPGHIHAGSCPEPGDVVQPLADAVMPTDQAVTTGVAAEVNVSTTAVPMAFADIIGAEHSINFHESADALDVYIACGDIAGTLLGSTDLAIALTEQNASGHTGTAWLHDNGDGTTRVDVILVVGGAVAPTESPAPASPAPVESPAMSPAPVESPAMSPAPVESPAMSPAAS